jgi:hypothetical protein
MNPEKFTPEIETSPEAAEFKTRMQNREDLLNVITIIEDAGLEALKTIFN